MRKCLAGVWAIAACVVACGGFGGQDEDQPPTPTPTDNSKPPPEPIDGKPIPGIYVSASKGQAGRTGFPGWPLKTLKEGLARAKAENLRLIVCAEEYAENVEIIDGVSMYGYYDCNVEPWVRSTRRAIVKAPASPAMVARDIKLPTRIEGFDVIAPDLDGTSATGRTGSSIGFEARRIPTGVLFVSDSTLHGGKAGAGTDGAPAVAPTASGTGRGTDGYNESYASCPDPMSMNCQNPRVLPVTGPSITCGDEPAPGAGGNGGDGMWLLDGQPSPNGATDLRGKPFSTNQYGTACGISPQSTCAPGLPGGKGDPGINGKNGRWRFDAEGFTSGDGERGTSGAPGQGGQGGGSADYWYLPGGYAAPPANITWARTARGGSGGSGGCGGLAGGAGTGGGASIGLLALEALVSLERDIVESSNGGRAGAGTLGSFGKVGGAGGVGGEGAKNGADGGSGGRGGASGHGAAGPSIAVAFLGLEPNLGGGVELRPGAGGEGRAEANDPPNALQATENGASLRLFAIKP